MEVISRKFNSFSKSMEIVPRLSRGVCSHLAAQIMLSSHLDVKRALAWSVLTSRLLNRALARSMAIFRFETGALAWSVLTFRFRKRALAWNILKFCFSDRALATF